MKFILILFRSKQRYVLPHRDSDYEHLNCSLDGGSSLLYFLSAQQQVLRIIYYIAQLPLNSLRPSINKSDNIAVRFEKTAFFCSSLILLAAPPIQQPPVSYDQKKFNQVDVEQFKCDFIEIKILYRI